MTETKKIRRALISVSNKDGLIEFARVLDNFGIEILSTGGTATFLQQHGIPVIEISDYTSFPEIMNGRVKTLHPKIHGGILARRNIDDATLQTHNIQWIDLVVVNLYPFETVIKADDCTFEHAIENIDIGGPSLIRAAAKNHQDVTVIVDPKDYTQLCEAIANEQGISAALRLELARKAFARTAAYDAQIANYLYRENTDELFPQIYMPCFYKKMSLRYGENPHQAAALYLQPGVATDTIATAKKLQGKDLSFNNLADANAALSCVKQFKDAPACVIVKHANPCGAAIGETILTAYQKAFATDPKSAFGGIIAVNRLLDAATLEAILNQQFVEVLIAPQIETEALAIAKQKPNLRLMIYGTTKQTDAETTGAELEYKTIERGLLVQTVDHSVLEKAKLQFVTKRAPDKSELADLLFAWNMVKFVKSNAIVYARDQQTIGIGAGQMSRIDSAELGLKKAQDAKLAIKNAVMASDAFFPFRDVVDIAAKNAISAIIQPGGSVRDAEVIQAADEANIAMVFTGIRLFSH